MAARTTSRKASICSACRRSRRRRIEDVVELEAVEELLEVRIGLTKGLVEEVGLVEELANPVSSVNSAAGRSRKPSRHAPRSASSPSSQQQKLQPLAKSTPSAEVSPQPPMAAVGARVASVAGALRVACPLSGLRYHETFLRAERLRDDLMRVISQVKHVSNCHACHDI